MSAVTRRVRSVPNCVWTLANLSSGRRFALLIDDATGRAAAKLHACRAFEHLHLLEVEAVAVVAAEVANAVEEDVVACGEAADGEVVALGSAFAGGDADAGDVANRVEERVVLFVVENKLGDFNHRLRCVEDRLRELCHADGVGEASCHAHGFLVAKTDVHTVRTVEGEVKAGAGEELAQGGVVGIKSDDGVGRESGEGFGWDFQLQGYATLLAVLVEGDVKRTFGNPESSNRKLGGYRIFACRSRHHLLCLCV